MSGLALVILPYAVSLPSHGWDCIACQNNTMLAGNWAINSPYFNNSDVWWAHRIVSSYAAVAVNLNNQDTSITVEQAKILKTINPNFKFLIYENSELGPLTQEADGVINAHPEWWCRDDAGNVLKTKQGPFLNHSIPDVRTWLNSYPMHVFGNDSKALLDGVFYDGMGYNPMSLPNTNIDRHDAWFRGKMLLADEARALYGGLNGGELWVCNESFDTYMYLEN